MTDPLQLYGAPTPGCAGAFTGFVNSTLISVARPIDWQRTNENKAAGPDSLRGTSRSLRRKGVQASVIRLGGPGEQTVLSRGHLALSEPAPALRRVGCAGMCIDPPSHSLPPFRRLEGAQDDGHSVFAGEINGLRCLSNKVSNPLRLHGVELATELGVGNGVHLCILPHRLGSADGLGELLVSRADFAEALDTISLSVTNHIENEVLSFGHSKNLADAKRKRHMTKQRIFPRPVIDAHHNIAGLNVAHLSALPRIRENAIGEQPEGCGEKDKSSQEDDEGHAAALAAGVSPLGSPVVPGSFGWSSPSAVTRSSDAAMMLSIVSRLMF